MMPAGRRVGPFLGAEEIAAQRRRWIGALEVAEQVQAAGIWEEPIEVPGNPAPVREIRPIVPVPAPDLLHRVDALRMLIIQHLDLVERRVRLRMDRDAVVERARDEEQPALQKVLDQIKKILRKALELLTKVWNYIRRGHQVGEGEQAEAAANPDLLAFIAQLEGIKNRCVLLIDAYEQHLQLVREEGLPPRPIPARFTEEEVSALQAPLNDLIERVNRAVAEPVVSLELRLTINLFHFGALDMHLTLFERKDEALVEQGRRIQELQEQEALLTEMIERAFDLEELLDGGRHFDAERAKEEADRERQIVQARIEGLMRVRNRILTDYV